MRKPLIIITGASSGIGAATASLLSGLGHPLLLPARRLERLEELSLPDTLCRAVDITDRAALLAAVHEAEQKYGPADAIINNAGVMLLGQISKQDKGPAQRRSRSSGGHGGAQTGYGRCPGRRGCGAK